MTCEDCKAMEVLEEFERRLYRGDGALEALAGSRKFILNNTPLTKAELKAHDDKRTTCYTACAYIGCNKRIAYHKGEKYDKYCPEHQAYMNERGKKNKVR